MNTISRWESFPRLASLQSQVNRLFDTLPGSGTNASDLATWAPAMDILETENELVVKADLPDMDEKEIDIRVENNVLTIRGERKFDKNVTEENYLRVERAYGAFTRSFALPNTINPEQIHAVYNNGVLTVRLPKREETKPKQIKIAVSGAQAK